MLIDNSDDNLLETDRIIIQAINRNPESFLDIPIKMFANRANVAISTISKFVRRIGFKDYQSFQKHIAKSYALQKENDFLRLMNFKQKDTLTLKKYIFLAISETVKKIDFLVLDQLANIIINARKIWIIGKGENFLAAKDLAHELNDLGMFAFSTNEISNKMQQFSILNQSDFLLFISEKYIEKSYQELNIKLKKQKVKIGLITSLDKFFLDQKVDFVINFFTFPKTYQQEIVSSNIKIQQFLINNILINTILNKKNTAK